MEPQEVTLTVRYGDGVAVAYHLQNAEIDFTDSDTRLTLNASIGSYDANPPTSKWERIRAAVAALWGEVVS